MASPQRPTRGLVHALQVGEQVFLRPPLADDYSDLATLRRLSRDFLAPWEPRNMEDVATPAGFQLLLQVNRDPRYEKMLVCRLQDGALLGAINLNDIVRGPVQNGCIGYWIGQPYARKGFMREALDLALAYAFRTLQLHRVEANVMPHNRASLALIRRAGFRREGYSLRYLEIAGRWQDHERWALLEEEWAAWQARSQGTRSTPAHPDAR